MPKITALLHANNSDAPCLGQALDSLRVCDQLLVINHGSEAIEKLAKEHGATSKTAITGVSPGAYLVDASYDWILCLRPSEALSASLQAALERWKQEDHDNECAVSIVLAQNGHAAAPETRLVNRRKINWTEELPPNDFHSSQLAGELVRCLH